MIYLLYDLILCLSALFLVPYYLLRGLRYGKTRRGIRERRARYTKAFLASLGDRPVIWIHAVSVGETRAAAPLLRALRRDYPRAFLLLSQVTETGRETARGVPEADGLIFFPFDLSWVVRRALRLIRPRLIVLVETELWPNFLHQAQAQKIPVVIVNGRISDRSFPRYRRAGSLLRPLLTSVSGFCMQTVQDGERIRLLGAPAERVEVTGNLKFDMAVDELEGARSERLRERFGLPREGLLWVAGSTHQGEEEQVLAVFRRLQDAGLPISLVLVPRRPERAKSVGELLTAAKLPWRLRSSLPAETHPPPRAAGEVLLVDTIGEMLLFYAMADLVFVGGSLLPLGGHNALEAALLRKPVLFGPYMQNFREIARLLLRAEAGLQVADAEALFHGVQALLVDGARRRAMGERGYQLLEQHRGATERTMTVLSRHLADVS
jgi:3-deoxy-D-manno-octulosonic-acid transferase